MNGCGCGHGRGCDQGRGYKQSYHLQHLPPPPLNHLPPPLVSSITVGPAEMNYYAQHGGGPPSVASTYMAAASLQQQPKEFYMANDGKFYCKLNADVSAQDCLKSINVDQWFETVATSPQSLETHLLETVKSI